MASLVKNQILKHLSKFTKNLSPDKINISALKGEGEMKNLELEENVLMELLDLPTWLKLNKALCNKVSIKIQWTKLKSQPIMLYLDEVIVEVETCDKPRPPNSGGQADGYRPSGKYGFVDKVFDGITVQINAVTVNFKSSMFHASLQLSRVRVHSVTPQWQQCSDIRSARIRDTDRGEILLFKEVEWQTTRIEAIALLNSVPDMTSTPLRFIANQSKIRIGLKKRLNDCSIVSSRVILLLDDLLWVFTDTQLKAAILYAQSLTEVIAKSTEQSKQLAADKLQKQGQTGILQQASQQQRPSNSPSAKSFNRFDVTTTSYHLVTGRIDLHLCDDSSPDKGASPKHNQQIEGGAMQVTIYKLSMDHYPYHPAGGDRKQWYRYNDTQGSRTHWVKLLLDAFKDDVKSLIGSTPVPSAPQSPVISKSNLNSPIRQSPSSPSRMRSTGQGQKGSNGQGRTKLLESCFVLKMEEFTIYRVSTADNKRNTLQKFLSSDKKQLHLPPDMSVIHMEYTNYFFPDDTHYPVPHANMYVLVNPVRLKVDYLTLLWANFFMLKLTQNVDLETSSDPMEHVDVKIEALMPRLILHVDGPCQPDRPNALQIQVSKVCVTNCRVEEKMSRSELARLLEVYDTSGMFKQTDSRSTSKTSLTDLFRCHATNEDDAYLNAGTKTMFDTAKCTERLEIPQGFQKESQISLNADCLKLNSRHDVWSACIDQAWAEFLGIYDSKSRPVPFVESFPLSVWLCRPLSPETKCNGVPSPEKSVSARNGDLSPSNLKNNFITKPNSEHNDISLMNGNTPKSHFGNCDQHTETTLLSSDQNAETTLLSSDSVLSVSEENPDVQILVKVRSKLRVQINHPQYLFLMRCLDSFTKFQMQLNADIERYYDSALPPVNICIPLVIREIELAMIFPKINNSSSEYPSTSTESPDPVYADYDSGGHESDRDFIVDDIHRFHDDAMAIDSKEVPPLLLSKSFSDSSLQVPPHSGLDLTISQQDIPASQSALGFTQDMSSSQGSSREMSSLSSLDKKASLRKIADVKKSFTNALTNFTDKLKVKTDQSDDGSTYSDDVETMSIATDLSEDDFQMLSLDDFEEVPAFGNRPQPSDGESVTDSISDIHDEVPPTIVGVRVTKEEKELVSIVVFRLVNSEVFVQNKGDDIITEVQVHQLTCHEPGNMAFTEFYGKFSSYKGFVQDEIVTPEVLEYPIKLKYFLGPRAAIEASIVGATDFLQIGIKNYAVDFLVSSLANIPSLIEDDTVGTPIPMELKLEEVKITLKDEASVFLDAPERPPVILHITHADVIRTMDGIFHMTTDNSFADTANLPRSIRVMNTVATETDDQSQYVNPSLKDEATVCHETVSNLGIVKNGSHEVNEDSSIVMGNDTFNTENIGDTKSFSSEESLNRKYVTASFGSRDEQNLDKNADNDIKQYSEGLMRLLDASNAEVQMLRFENEALKSQYLINDNANMESILDAPINCDMDTARNLEMENLKLVAKLSFLQEDMETMAKEKESLLATLRLLQEELLSSEQRRMDLTNSHVMPGKKVAIVRKSREEGAAK